MVAQLTAGSYFPAQRGVHMDDEWPLGDEKTWRTALDAEDIDQSDTQAVANNVVRHVTTSLARQASNLDNVGFSVRMTLRQIAAYQATALSVRDQLLKRWNDTTT